MKSVNQIGKIDSMFMIRLVTFITETNYQNLPQEVVLTAKQAILDTMGVALAGWNEPAVEIAKKVYASQVNEHGGVSSLWGDSLKVECDKAAIINGTASHVLDYDDASSGVVIHPSAPILSAVIPLAEKIGATGKEIITAYAVGTEVMVRIGQVMGIRHYSLGWHATDTLGTLGASAACSYLLHLNAEQCANAIAIAASMAGGLRKNFGSMTKPLHVGLSASHGIQAAELAKCDFTGNIEIFGEHGFFTAFSGGAEQQELDYAINAIRFGEPFDILTGLSVKKFPCCFGTHRFIQGTLDLREEHHLHLEDIQEIVLRAQSRSFLPLVHSRPVTGLQGKFSAEYTVLAAINDGDIGLSSFEDEKVQRRKIQELLPSVKLLELQETIQDKQSNKLLPIEIQIRTKSGKTFDKTVLHAPGSLEKPLNEKEYREKWKSCLIHFSSATSNNSNIEQIADGLYEQGLQIDSYTCFGEWINDIRKQFNNDNPKQVI